MESGTIVGERARTPTAHAYSEPRLLVLSPWRRAPLGQINTNEIFQSRNLPFLAPSHNADIPNGKRGSMSYVLPVLFPRFFRQQPENRFQIKTERGLVCKIANLFRQRRYLCGGNGLLQMFTYLVEGTTEAPRIHVSSLLLTTVCLWNFFLASTSLKCYLQSPLQLFTLNIKKKSSSL